PEVNKIGVRPTMTSGQHDPRFLSRLIHAKRKAVVSAVLCSTVFASVAMGDTPPASTARVNTVPAARRFDDCSRATWCPQMVVIPGGTFVMGSATSEAGRFDDESPQHRVTVHSFALGAYPITRGQWAAYAAATRQPLPQGPCAYA